jgi:hypothetical protein
MVMSSEEQLHERFPGLISSLYRITSPFDPKYNCIAWAAEDTQHWWEPDPMGVCYWPDDTPRTYSLSSYASAFASLGFRPSADETTEKGFTKVALFARGSLPTHAARQISSFMWTSKLGKNVDISHELRALCGDFYGEVAVFLKKAQELSAS